MINGVIPVNLSLLEILGTGKKFVVGTAMIYETSKMKVL
jgi:hypothetical protein